MSTNISDLRNKVENEGMNDQGRLGANEFNRLVNAVIENQNIKVKLDSRDPVGKNEDGIIELQSVSQNAVMHFAFPDGEEPSSEIISTSGSIPIRFRFVSQNENERDTGEGVRLVIRENINNVYTEVATLSYTARPIDSTVYDTLELADYFSAGTHDITLEATGLITGKTDTLLMRITLTTLTLTNVTDFHRVQKAGALGSISYRFAVGGNIPQSDSPSVIRSKRLSYIVETYVNGIRQSYSSNRSMTSSETSSIANPTTLDIPLSQFSSHGSGVYTIKAQLEYIETVSGVQSVIDSTTYVFAQILVEETGSPLSHPYIILQDIASRNINQDTAIRNYESAVFARYAILNTTESDIQINFFISSSNRDVNYWSGDISVAPTVTDENMQTGTLTVMAEAESMADLIEAVFYVNRGEEDFLAESIGTPSPAVGGIALTEYGVKIDNAEKFIPTAGADFYLNPKSRSNEDANPRSIVNAVDGSTVQTTFTNMHFEGTIDGYTTDGQQNQQRVFRVLAGSESAIQYYPFSNFSVNPASNMTLELDFAARNVTNYEDPIIKICAVDALGKVYGIQIKPTEGVIMTASKTTYGEQDFHWHENKRTHVMVNILSAYYPTADSSFVPSSVYTNGMPVVRVFVDGVINREIIFDRANTGEFSPASASHVGIVIGQGGCDVDIYGIRCYKGGAGLSYNDCVNNYKVALPTGDEKQAFKKANDIVSSETDTIVYTEAIKQYNTLLWHGAMPYGKNDATKADTTGWLEIRMLDEEGNLEAQHSGSFCRDTKALGCKGQGTTAKTYYYWNLQWDLSKVKAKTTVGGEQVTDGFRLTNGTWVGSTYAVSDKVVAGQKMVLKINYASSMQSHKQGATDLYNDLYRLCVGATEIQSYSVGSEHPYDKTRVTVLERPVMLFVQATENGPIEFQGLGTFGPGKMDKKTWGYDKSVFPDFGMFEGADNNMPLTDMRVPWGEDFDTFGIRYDAEEEAYMYNGAKNVNFDAGKTDDDGTPIGEAPLAMRRAFNFLFNHNPRIMYYNGTYSQFVASYAASKVPGYEGVTFDETLQYYMKQADTSYSDRHEYGDAYNLFRYDFKNDEWVPAGYDMSNDSNVRKNLQTLYGQLTGYTNDEQERKLYQYRIAKHAKEGLTYTYNGTTYNDTDTIATYFDTASIRFHYAFVVLFLAGTDNCSKNTYYVVSPFSHKIEMHQDDLDTIFKTDNSGFQLKPYYIDRMRNGAQYYEGNANVLNDLIELMYEGEHVYATSDSVTSEVNTELRDMLKSILTQMTNLVTAEDGYDRTPFGCIDKYFFSIQRYFPAVAYNETARLRYEIPEYVGYRSVGRNIAPITQSLGDQLQSEIQYLRQRLVMISSMAAYGDFGVNSTNNLGLTRGQTAAPTFMHLQSALYLYPNFRNGQSLTPSPYQQHLMEEGEHYDLSIGSNPSETDTAYGLNGRDYFYSFGDLSDYKLHSKFATGTGLDIQGAKLREFKIMDATQSTFFDVKGGITIHDAPIFEELIIHSPKFEGPVNIGTLTRLRVLDLNGTSAGTVAIPQSPVLETIDLRGTLTSEVSVTKYNTALQSLRLGSNVQVLSINGTTNLTTLTLQGYAALAQLSISDDVPVNTLEFVMGCYSYNITQDANVVNNINLTGIDWSNATASFLNWLLSVNTLTLTGRIHMVRNSSGQITFALKKKLIEKFGNVDSESNSLYIDYESNTLGSVQVSGDGYFDSVGEVRHYDLIPNVASGNTIKSYAWTISGGSSGIDPDDYAEVDALGNVTCKQMGVESGGSGPTVTLQCVVTLTNGNTLPAVTMDIRCYFRQAKLGDYVYHDGTWDDRLNVAKSVIGICFYCKKVVVDGGAGDWYDRRMVACANVNSRPWGLYPNGDSKGTNGFASSGANALKYMLNGVTTDPWDVPLLSNITSAGASYTTYANMIDTNNLDPGFPENDPQHYFKQYSNSTAVGRFNLVEMGQSIKSDVFGSDNIYTAESMVPQGLYDTACIIRHRNNVLSGTTYDNGTPSNPDDDTNYTYFKPSDDSRGNLSDKMLAIKNFAANTIGDTYTDIYMQYLYPAASECFAYEPSVSSDNVLADKFKCHHWYLPSIGELARLCFLLMTCYSGSSIYEASAAALFGDIFVNAVTAGKFTRMSASDYWSSTECDIGGTWNVHFGSGVIYRYTAKSSAHAVRPVAAF